MDNGGTMPDCWPFSMENTSVHCFTSCHSDLHSLQQLYHSLNSKFPPTNHILFILWYVAFMIMQRDYGETMILDYVSCFVDTTYYQKALLVWNRTKEGSSFEREAILDPLQLGVQTSDADGFNLSPVSWGSLIKQDWLGSLAKGFWNWNTTLFLFCLCVPGKFFPPLTGAEGKMAASDENSVARQCVWFAWCTYTYV